MFNYSLDIVIDFKESNHEQFKDKFIKYYFHHRTLKIKMTLKSRNMNQLMPRRTKYTHINQFLAHPYSD
jgi:hypothetical protein